MIGRSVIMERTGPGMAADLPALPGGRVADTDVEIAYAHPDIGEVRVSLAEATRVGFEQVRPDRSRPTAASATIPACTTRLV
jgi:hypothetical protein